MKCKRQHPNAKIAICRFDSLHHIPVEEIASHERQCMKNHNIPCEEINVTWKPPSPTKNASAVFTADDDDDWSVEYPTYDPKAAAENKEVLRLKQCCTKVRELH